MRTLVTPALGLCLAMSLAGGCRNTQQSATPGCPDEQAGAVAGADHHHHTGEGTQVKVVNAYCPIAGTHAVGKDGSVDETLSREWKGQQVGFCCGHCLPVWDKMSGSQRDAALAAAIKNSR